MVEDELNISGWKLLCQIIPKLITLLSQNDSVWFISLGLGAEQNRKLCISDDLQGRRLAYFAVSGTCAVQCLPGR